ncbi:MAG: cytochrome P460 family protein [Bryobacteraceae bacterium]
MGISRLAGIALLFAGTIVAQAPQFTSDGRLVKPDNYREWVFLSSGLGMTYGPAANADQNSNPEFDNVFVTPAAYRAFVQTGKWPDKTMFVLEVRSSESHGSINHGGHFQSDLVAIETEVKKPGGQWTFYGFGQSAGPAKAIPTSASCYQCHRQNGAVDNTFVQFYPTLLSVAKAKGTLRGDTH